jgi:hypothetical protein
MYYHDREEGPQEGISMRAAAKSVLKIADEVWIATALLQREQPEHTDFSVEEIVARAAKESLAGSNRPGVYVHVVQHCVANRPPNPGRYRILFETAPGRRRLFRKGDSYHPAREGAKTAPNTEDIPHGYGGLLSWYRDWSSQRAASDEDPLLALAGSGADIWSDERADPYVRRLREGWA